MGPHSMRAESATGETEASQSAVRSGEVGAFKVS
jgi:hypothetical protein